ncbi:MAG: hypothetical protein KatS3mg054_0640 [Chloroflexus sp.]|nr:MAG: hypothetical protein KatS3mg054_0640 [Chloroflexus sp.]
MTENIIIKTVKHVARLAPPKTISLALPDTESVEAMLKITYSTMIETRSHAADGVAIASYSRPADTYHLLDVHHTPQGWHDIMSEAGWVLGAGYMYRWHYAPGQTLDHLWGLLRYDLGDGDITATGNADDVLAELCRQFGAWHWEINSAYMLPAGLVNWRAEDPTRSEDGTRPLPFSGWAGEHPWLRATQPNTIIESRYYYVMPAHYDKRTDALSKHIVASAASALGRLGGSARSEAKTAANRAKANLPPKPGKRPRGRPKSD